MKIVSSFHEFFAVLTKQFPVQDIRLSYAEITKSQVPRGLSETLSGMFIKYVDERSVISNVYNHPCVDKVVIRVANELK